jgi:MFS-type transporter involved in bile tolerance (Atg22 family)
MVAVRFIPVGVGMGAVSEIAGYLPNYFQVKRILLTGIAFAFAGTILLPFANTEKMYWPLVFPGFCLGTVGAMLMYSSTK